MPPVHPGVFVPLSRFPTFWACNGTNGPECQSRQLEPLLRVMYLLAKCQSPFHKQGTSGRSVLNLILWLFLRQWLRKCLTLLPSRFAGSCCFSPPGQPFARKLDAFLAFERQHSKLVVFRLPPMNIDGFSETQCSRQSNCLLMLGSVKRMPFLCLESLFNCHQVKKALFRYNPRNAKTKILQQKGENLCCGPVGTQFWGIAKDGSILLKLRMGTFCRLSAGVPVILLKAAVWYSG